MSLILYSYLKPRHVVSSLELRPRPSLPPGIFKQLGFGFCCLHRSCWIFSASEDRSYSSSQTWI